MSCREAQRKRHRAWKPSGRRARRTVRPCLTFLCAYLCMCNIPTVHGATTTVRPSSTLISHRSFTHRSRALMADRRSTQMLTYHIVGGVQVPQGRPGGCCELRTKASIPQCRPNRSPIVHPLRVMNSVCGGHKLCAAHTPRAVSNCSNAPEEQVVQNQRQESREQALSRAMLDGSNSSSLQARSPCTTAAGVVQP